MRHVRDKEAADAALSRVALAKERYMHLKEIKAVDDDAVSAEDLRSALLEWKAAASAKLPDSHTASPAPAPLSGTKRRADSDILASAAKSSDE